VGPLFGDPTLPSVTGLDLEPVDEIDHVVEPATGAGADTASGDGDSEMGFAGAGRTSVIMPGVRRLKCGSFILSIHDTARLLSRSAASATLALTI
jgi:hypothetical protein